MTFYPWLEYFYMKKTDIKKMVNRKSKWILWWIWSRTYFGCYSSWHKNLLVLLLLGHHVSGSLSLTISVGLWVINIQCQLLLLIESATLFRSSTTWRVINGVEITTALYTRSWRLLRRKWHLICVYILDV